MAEVLSIERRRTADAKSARSRRLVSRIGLGLTVFLLARLDHAPVAGIAAALAPPTLAAEVATPSSASAGATADPGPAATSSVGAPSATGEALDASKAKLQNLESTLTAAEVRRRQIEADIESIRTDRVRLTAALIETTTHVHEAEAKVAAVETRLDALLGSEEAIKHSLTGRRSTIGAVLAALQRMGRKPLPAILVRPEDMLLAIRTSMLLGAVVPRLRAETEALASDLEELGRVRQSIVTDRDKLTQESAILAAEQARLQALVAARQAAQSAAESNLVAEQSRAAEVAHQATSLKDLIARMEADLAAARRGADAAGAADDARRKAAETEAPTARDPAADPFRDPARLAPVAAFADTKGLLPLPVSGTLVKSFGADDGFGSIEHGVSIATRPGAVVSAPCDGWISFAGPWRSYGQLLIINAGGGYHVVLAGLDHSHVVANQFVLAGEAVGAMGDGSVKTAAAIALGAAQPILYVEFRKDGAAIDPGPWWAKAELEKVRG